MRRLALWGIAAFVAVSGVAAQAPGRLELVRCVAGNDVPCLHVRVALDANARSALAPLDSARGARTWRGTLAGNSLIAPALGAIPGEFADRRELTFGVGAIGVAALARSAASGSIELEAGADRTTVARLTWRPPLMAMPAFQAIADSATLSPALRETLLLGAGGGGDRPIIGLCVALLVIGIWLMTERVGLREIASEPPPPRERSATTRTGSATALTEEGPPRKPEDITNQTARRTALRR